MDICVEAAAVTYHEMLCSGENESSAAIRCRVEGARQIQAERFRGLGIFCNGEMNGKQVRTYCVLGKEENAFMKDVFTQIQLSARTYDRILKVARTAADLEGAPEIGRRHLCEAVSYMQIKERYW
jgi:magnesium chelatase family protein